MKKGLFIVLFLSLHVLFIFLQIFKYSAWAKETYKRQQLEKEKKNLLAKKESLLQQFCMLKDPVVVKKYAQNVLGMEPIRIQQIKQLQELHD